MGKHIQYSGVVAFTKAVEAAQPLPGAGPSSTRYGNRPDWDFGLGFDGAIAMGKSGGWKEGSDKIAKAVELATPFIRQGGLPAFEIGRAGFVPDVPSYLRGSPCDMWGYGDEEITQKPIVRVGVQCCRAGAMKADAILNRGAAILGIIDELENSGYRVELTACLRTGGGFLGGTGTAEEQAKSQFSFDIMIKEASEQWNPTAAAFALCHPAFSRRLAFRIREATPETLAITSNGTYGGDFGADRLLSDFDVWFPYETSDTPWQTIEKAVDSARRIFNQRGYSNEE